MKTPERRQAQSGVVGEQLNLIDPPQFCDVFPPPASLTAEALRLLLTGRTLTHPDFEDITGSWRLGAYICTLREMYWPVETQEILCPSPDCPNRVIARYAMPQWVISELGGNHGA
jgi:hypothetical protein